MRKHPGVETPGYCRVVPLGRQVEDDEAASGLPERFAFRQVQTPRRRLAMTRQAVGEISMPIHCRLFFSAATNAVNVPSQGLYLVQVKNADKQGLYDLARLLGQHVYASDTILVFRAAV